MTTITTAEDFKALVQEIQGRDGYRKPLAFGICRVQTGQLNRDKILTCTFPVVNWEENFGSAAIFWHACGGIAAKGPELVTPITKDSVDTMASAFMPYRDEAHGDAHKNVQIVKALKREEDLSPFRLVMIFEDTKIESLPAAYLKLAAMSARKAAPRTICFDGIFGVLENVAWSGNTAYELDWLRAREIELKMKGEYPRIDSVDKFPLYLAHVIPEATTRILESSKVRFGAYLSEGTVVMPGASYVNFNAGTLGKTMVEGRISSSATVGEGTDVGGGASILGTLSGGNNTPISIGKNCLLGANSTTGIPLGDGCIVDAGVTILAGTKLTITQNAAKSIADVNPETTFSANAKSGKTIFKGADLAGLNGVHYRVDSLTGAHTAARSNRTIELNAALH